MELHTLVLTPWITPHRIVTWQRAVTDFLSGDIEILDTYDGEFIASAGSETNPKLVLGTPCVARLKRPIASMKKGVKFSRINVFTRDDFTCQYCGRKLPMRSLNYDHVNPRRLGGTTVFENIVTSCYPCNSRKDGRTPEQAGMRLLRKPVRPSSLPMTSPAFSVRHMPDKWKEWLAPHVLAAAFG